MRTDNVRIGQPAPELRHHRALVRRIAVRMEEADGDSLGVDLRE